jgi:serine/threonine-protein kinase
LFITVTPDGREILKVLDFGIAKLADTGPTSDPKRSGALTGDHALGSPTYMAPEQVRNAKDIDERADIWALGAILYELVTGAEAFPGTSVGEIFGNVLHSTPTPVRKLTPEAPPAIESVIAMCLERDRANRFADVAELAHAIAPFGSGVWTAHVARIEHTLARAGKASDPSRSSPRHSMPEVFPPEGPSRSGWTPEPFSNTVRDRNKGEGPTLPTAEPPPSAPRRWRTLAIAGASCALALTVAIVWIAASAGRQAARLDTSTQTPTSSGVSAVAAQPPATTPATATESPSSSAAATSTASTTGTASVATTTKVPAFRPGKPSASSTAGAPATTKTKSPNPSLPGVLNSPD